MVISFTLRCLFFAPVFLSVLACTGLSSSSVVPSHQKNNAWYTQGEASIAQKLEQVRVRDAKNIILFVGDGMGVSTVTAARILEGQLNGMQGEENNLSFDLFPFSGLAKTYNVDAQIPDSAGTMTAMMTGVKTDAGVIGVDEDIVRGRCDTVAGNELVTALELAEIAGKATGIVSTARITHATPAATYAKSADRNWEDISDMPKEAITGGCEDIALQLIHFEKNLKARFPLAPSIDGLDVAFGGGRRHFLPNDVSANSPDARSKVEGDRTDGRHLVSEWQSQYPQGLYVFDQAGFDKIDPNKHKKVLGLFNESHMQYEADRKNDISGEPSIADMTQTALGILKQNNRGFFLMVESGRIDHSHHAGNAYGALTDTIALSTAVQTAVNLVDMRNTLIIVTADHSHVFTIAGYPKRGNPILGKVVPIGSEKPSLGEDGLPYTTLGYANGRGSSHLGDQTDADIRYDLPIETGRTNLTHINTELPGFHQEALVPMSAETHGGEDVAIYGTGQGGALVTGTNEQSVIYHVMNEAGQLVKDAERRLRRR